VADVSTILDIEIASRTPRVFGRARGWVRCNAHSCAVVPQVATSLSVDARAQVFLRPALPRPCAVTMVIVMVVCIGLFDGRTLQPRMDV
jgi:hypothetical protein